MTDQAGQTPNLGRGKVILSPTRKRFIREFKEINKYASGSSPIGVPGSDEWVEQLFHHINYHDNAVKMEHLRYWIKNHKWITDSHYRDPATYGFPAPAKYSGSCADDSGLGNIQIGEVYSQYNFTRGAGAGNPEFLDVKTDVNIDINQAQQVRRNPVHLMTREEQREHKTRLKIVKCCGELDRIIRSNHLKNMADSCTRRLQFVMQRAVDGIFTPAPIASPDQGLGEVLDISGDDI